MLLVAIVALMLASIQAVGTWHKVQFCRGRANEYDTRAAALLEAAAEPELSPAEAAELRSHARIQARIGRRYRDVVDRPWLPYPRYPLLPEFANRPQSPSP
jgi:hypothetical protein